MKEREVGNEENSSRRNCRGGLDVLSEREKSRGSEENSSRKFNVRWGDFEFHSIRLS